MDDFECPVSPNLSRSCRIDEFPIADIATAGHAGRMSEDNLIWLSRWYLSQCDNDWEHSYGVKIDNLDNPGWSLKIDLTDTEMQGRAFERIEHGEPSGDLEEWQRTGSWWVARVEGDAFEVACGPLDLSAAVGVFRRWVEAAA